MAWDRGDGVWYCRRCKVGDLNGIIEGDGREIKGDAAALVDNGHGGWQIADRGAPFKMSTCPHAADRKTSCRERVSSPV